jgi:teichuronic acid biosynthesis glycosyltransferase TuaG
LSDLICDMPEIQNIGSLISVIIPCYNAEKFIGETINWVIKQSYANWELIIVNDGSTDNSETIISGFLNDQRVRYYKKENKGVSHSRNYGLKYATGEFVLFLDADDLPEPEYFKKTTSFLEKNLFYSGCSTVIRIIDEHGNIDTASSYHGVHNHIQKQILSYNEGFSTCPSAYVFRKKILDDHQLLFNEKLSSPADKYFLIEFSRYGSIGLLEDTEKARLLYRIHSSNMSRGVSMSLLEDNKLFMEKILSLSYIHPDYKKMLRFKMYYILAGGYFKLRKFTLCFSYAIRSFFLNPLLFIKQLCVG